MEDRNHFTQIHDYIVSRTGDNGLATRLTEGLRQGKLRSLTSILEDSGFQDECEPEEPSEFYAEDWRKIAYLQLEVDGNSLFFQVVFSKTPDCIRVVTAFPHRKGKSGVTYQKQSC